MNFEPGDLVKFKPGKMGLNISRGKTFVVIEEYCEKGEIYVRLEGHNISPTAGYFPHRLELIKRPYRHLVDAEFSLDELEEAQKIYETLQISCQANHN